MHERELAADIQLRTDLQLWAQEYADKSGGRMEVLDYVPGNPAQDGISVQGEPNDSALIDSIASLAQPRYSELLASLHDDAQSMDRLDMAGEIIKKGENVILVTNHGDLIDIAVTQAGIYSSLEKLGVKMHDTNKKDHGYEARTGIIISKMVAFLGFKLTGDPAPCTDILKVLESEIFLSYPKTESTKKHLKDRLLPDEVERHNKKMRRSVIEKLGEGSMLLAMAASGTTDKLDAVRNSIIMGKLGMGTMEFMHQPGTYVLPVSVWYQGERAVMKTADIPRIVRGEEQAHGVMHKIADTLNQEVSDQNFAYAG